MSANESEVIVGRVTTWYQRRWIFTVLFVLGSAAWFGYDGAIGYPKQNEIARAFEKFKQEGREDDWRTFARARDWPDAKNIPEIKTPAQIRTQIQFAVGGGILGLVLLAFFLYRRSRVLKVDGANLYTPEGQTVPFASIVSIDTKQWPDKGLAKVRYVVNGTERTARIDGLGFGGFAGPKPPIADQILARVLAKAPAGAAPPAPASPQAAPSPPQSASPDIS